jgi:ribosomal protein S12 methylthiotransferase accessory factor
MDAALREHLSRRAPVPKRFRGGTHRLRPPEDTLARVRPLMPLLGITRIADITGLDTLGIPVVMVCRPNARSLSVSQGKGLLLAAAQASGLMESVEMWHAEHLTLPLKLASLNELRFTHRMVDLAGLPRSSANSFHAELRMLWVEGRDWLQEGASTWLPHEVVHMDYRLPLPPGSGAFFMSSSGLASGNHLLEALSHAVCELVEHDATTLWSLGGEAARRRTRLDLGTVDDPACCQVLERYERAGISVAVWETTSDIGLPSFVCMIADREPAPLRPLAPAGGMGCHPTREVALLRALTEAAQSRLTLIAGSRDDVTHGAFHDHERALAAWRELLDWTQADGPQRRFQEVPTWEEETFDEDVAWELERLRAAGLRQMVAVELTKPELGIPVVRVVIPGLEGQHDAPGYVPGARAQRVLQEALKP